MLHIEITFKQYSTFSIGPEKTVPCLIHYYQFNEQQNQKRSVLKQFAEEYEVVKYWGIGQRNKTEFQDTKYKSVPLETAGLEEKEKKDRRTMGW